MSGLSMCTSHQRIWFQKISILPTRYWRGGDVSELDSFKCNYVPVLDVSLRGVDKSASLEQVGILSGTKQIVLAKLKCFRYFFIQR